MGQAAARAGLPGAAGKATAAALNSAVEALIGAPHTVRVSWADGGQSLIALPDPLFLHLSVSLKEHRLASTLPDTVASTPAEVVDGSIAGQIAKLAGPALGGGLAAWSIGAPQPDVLAQIAKLAELRDRGIVTDEEFTSKKAELLNRL